MRQGKYVYNNLRLHSDHRENIIVQTKKDFSFIQHSIYYDRLVSYHSSDIKMGQKG